MAINPEDITTVRVDQLANLGLTLESLFPHTVGTELTSSPISDLVTLVATAIESGSGVGFLPVSVTDGQTLPAIPENPSFILVGAGTFINLDGFPNLVCTENLNALMTVDTHWEIAVEIPINPLTGTVESVTGSAVDNTDPLNPVINLQATPTLQQVTDEGATTSAQIEAGAFLTLGSTNSGGYKFNDGDDADEIGFLTPDIEVVSASSRTWTLPNLSGAIKATKIISTNETATNNGDYTVIANATFTDPTPAEGKGYTVFVRNGTATIGGVGYTVGSLVYRVYHSGAWGSTSIGGTVPDASPSVKGIAKLYSNLLASNTDGSVHQSALVTEFNLKDVLPVIYEKHANVPIFGSASLNNLEGVAFVLTGATSRTFADTNLYSRRQRLGLVSPTTASAAQARQTATYFNRNSNFKVIVGLGFNENCTASNVRGFAGVCANVSTFGNVEPTTLTNCFGIAKLSTSNNVHVIHNDGSGTATAIDLGASFPSNTIATDFYIFIAETVGSDIVYSVTRVNTGDTATGTITTDLPATTQGLNLGFYIVQNTGANTNTGIDFFGTNLIKQ